MIAKVVTCTPIDLTRVIKINKPYEGVRYERQEIGQATLKAILMQKFWAKVRAASIVGFQ